MKFIDFWFDPISPYAYLAFERMPEVLQGLTYSVRYRPVLFGALLKHWSHKGPAEIEPKRAWTYRQVLWIAHRHGIELQMPAQHPFNPLALLRLLHACASPPGGTPNRHACRTVLHHVWQGGADADDADRLAALTAQLAPRLDPSGDEAKQALRDATAHAHRRRPLRRADARRSTASRSGDSTRSRWSRPICAATPGSRPAAAGIRPPRRAPGVQRPR